MGLTVTIDDGPSGDLLRDLHGWLAEEDDLRGCLRLRERPPADGRLGPVLDALQVIGAPGVAALSAALVAWLRTRVGNVNVVITDENGRKVELNARTVRGLDAKSVAELTGRIAELDGVTRTDAEPGPAAAAGATDPPQKPQA